MSNILNIIEFIRSSTIALKERIEDQLGWTVVIPDYLESEDL